MDGINDDCVINLSHDIETIKLELIFSDIEMLDRRIDRSRKMAKGDKKFAIEVEFLEKLKAHLENGKPARSFEFSDEEKEIIKKTPLLSNKPVIYAANLCEDDYKNRIETNKHYQTLC